MTLPHLRLVVSNPEPEFPDDEAEAWIPDEPQRPLHKANYAEALLGPFEPDTPSES